MTLRKMPVRFVLDNPTDSPGPPGTHISFLHMVWYAQVRRIWVQGGLARVPT